MLCGGYLNEVPQPHKRKWPGFHRPRRVTVKVQSWIQMGIGTHYYVDIVEEDNPIWSTAPYEYSVDREVVGWQICWDDKEGKGRCFYKRCKNIVEAKAYVDEIVKEYFSDGDYLVENHYANVIEEFQYRVEGD